MEQANSESIGRKWYNRWWGIVFLLVLVVVILGLAIFIYNLVYYLEKGGNENTNSIISKNVTIETTDDPATGAANPLITIVEFGDFQCPYCKEEAPIIIRVVLQYSKEVKLIFRDFPISAVHPDAMGAALAADCAYEQGKFWEYHDLLYQNQDDLSIQNLLVMAKSLGLDFDKFSTCLANRKYENEIQNDLLDGVKLEITGTPTFFINGYKVQGVISYPTWVDLIEKYKLLINKK